MNLSDWADRVGVNKHTAYRWYREGKLPVPARRVGRLILVDRDINAALNLRDWPDTASSGPVGTTAPNVSSLASSGGDVGSDTGITGAGGATVRLGIKPEPVAVRPEPMEASGLPMEPRERGAA